MEIKNQKYGKKMSITLSFVALNLVIGSLVSFLKIPIYLDSLGIVLATLLIGWHHGILCAILTVGIGFFLINPYLPAYIFTSLAIATTVYFLRKINFFSSCFKTIISGLIIAVISATFSAPITAFLFEGSTLSGNDGITAFFLTTGRNIWKSVFLSGLSSEPSDKIIVCLIAFQIMKSIPDRFINKNSLRKFRDEK